MADRDYILGRAAPPSAVTRFVDQNAIPAAIDAAAAVERGFERLAQAARSRPAAALGLAVGAGCLLAQALTRRRTLR